MQGVLRNKGSDVRFTARAPVDNQPREDSTENMTSPEPLTEEEVRKILRESAPNVRALTERLRHVFVPNDSRKRLR
jgi:hypothetical protein